MATRNAIRPNASPYLSYDADPATFSAAHFYLDRAAAQSPPEADAPISGCAFSPDVAIPHPRAGRATSGLFVLGQNYPNPFAGQTAVPFTLAAPADVKLSLFDASNRKVAGVIRKGLQAGEHQLALNLNGLGLAAGDYTYQLHVTTRYGVASERQTMTAK